MRQCLLTSQGADINSDLNHYFQISNQVPTIVNFETIMDAKGMHHTSALNKQMRFFLLEA